MDFKTLSKQSLNTMKDQIESELENRDKKKPFSDYPIGTKIRISCSRHKPIGIIISGSHINQDCVYHGRAILLTHFSTGKPWFQISEGYLDPAIKGEFEVIND